MLLRMREVASYGDYILGQWVPSFLVTLSCRIMRRWWLGFALSYTADGKASRT